MTASTVITPHYLEDRGTFQTITAMEAYSSKSIEVSSLQLLEFCHFKVNSEVSICRVQRKSFLQLAIRASRS